VAWNLVRGRPSYRWHLRADDRIVSFDDRIGARKHSGSHLPEVEINLSDAPPPATTLMKPPFSAVMTHAPTEIQPTPPMPVTSHAVTSDDYPPVSIRLAEQGLVKIRYLVQADGTVGECAVITSSGSSRLDDAACTMVKRRWRFTPATQKGKPVAEYLLAEVSFELVPSCEN
jgi:TonB family protein